MLITSVVLVLFISFLAKLAVEHPLVVACQVEFDLLNTKKYSRIVMLYHI